MNKNYLPVLAVLLTVGCSSLYPRALSKQISVTHNYSHDVDFSRLKSYRWVPLSETMTSTAFGTDVLASMKIAFTDALEAKGFMRVKENPDFLVALYGVSEGRIQSTDWGYNYMWDTRSWGEYWEERRVSSREYQEGTLVLDILDGQKRELLWSGTAQAVLLEGSSGEKRNERIDEAVAKLLDPFPPQE